LNLLEGYFSVHNFSNREKITFALLKVVPHVKYWWETFCEKKETEEPDSDGEIAMVLRRHIKVPLVKGSALDSL
jgi:hypothetical protein